MKQQFLAAALQAAVEVKAMGVTVQTKSKHCVMGRTYRQRGTRRKSELNDMLLGKHAYVGSDCEVDV